MVRCGTAHRYCDIVSCEVVSDDPLPRRFFSLLIARRAGLVSRGAMLIGHYGKEWSNRTCLFKIGFFARAGRHVI